jgi:hypothetical protein
MLPIFARFSNVIGDSEDHQQGSFEHARKEFASPFRLLTELAPP